MPYSSDFPLSSLLGNLTKYIPTWMKMHKDPESIGAQFLNVFALEFEDIERYLQYIDSLYISTIDTSIPDITYKSTYIDAPSDVTAFIDDTEYALTLVGTLQDFFNMDHVYILDIEKKILYTKIKYDYFYLDGVETKQHVNYIWNYFDEFGLLVDTPRLPEERNAEYKERLLAVFRCPANSTDIGIVNGIARHLGLIKSAEWPDDSVPFSATIYCAKIGHIWVDWKLVDDTVCTIDRGVVTINPLSESGSGSPRTVQYIDFLLVNELWDEGLKRVLYNSDGTATSKLVHIANKINRKVPVFWNDFIWDKSYWDVIDEKVSGVGCVPSIWDADIEAWRGREVLI
jgi:hypothetical protein